MSSSCWLAGSMQVLGKPGQSRAAPRAVPVTPVAAETAAAGSGELGQAANAEPTHCPAPEDGTAAAGSEASAAPAGTGEPSPTAQASQNGVAEAAPAAAPGAGLREGTPADGDRSAEQGSSSGAGPPVPASPQSQVRFFTALLSPYSSQ